MKIRSTAFADNQPIPQQHTGDGKDVSPPLDWTDVPADAVELALIVDDPDAPTPTPWVHWVVYGLPASLNGLPEGIPPAGKLAQPVPACQGRNSWPSGGTIGYRGPAPPPGHGVHHYHFKLYALDAKLELDSGLTKDDVLEAMDGKVLAEAELVGTYER